MCEVIGFSGGRKILLKPPLKTLTSSYRGKMGRKLMLISLSGIVFSLFLAFSAAGQQNLIVNPSAEEVMEKKAYPRKYCCSFAYLADYVPANWCCYLGDGECEWGATDKEAHTGKYSAFLKIKQPSKSGEYNFALIPHYSTGYTGKDVPLCQAGTKYYFSFWIKGNIPEVSSKFMFGWSTEEASCDDRIFIGTSLGKIFPTGEWTKYEGTLLTPNNCKKFILFFQTKGFGFKESQTIYIDDVELMLYE